MISTARSCFSALAADRLALLYNNPHTATYGNMALAVGHFEFLFWFYTLTRFTQMMCPSIQFSFELFHAFEADRRGLSFLNSDCVNFDLSPFIVHTVQVFLIIKSSSITAQSNFSPRNFLKRKAVP